jgi:integrase
MASQHLTDASIKRLPVPDRGSRKTYDADVPGFGICITANSVRSFILRYRTRTGRERCVTMGQFPNWSTVGARQEARRLKQEIDRGFDPLADIEDARAAPTIADLLDRFDAEHVAKKRPRTADEYRQIARTHVRPHFGKQTKVADIQYEDIAALHRSVTESAGPYAANRTVAMLSKAFALAIRWRLRSDNPCKGIEKNTEHKRKRYLKPEELERLVVALAAHPNVRVANIIRVLMLTGCRKGEALSMRWQDIDLAVGKWTKPAAVTKTGIDHDVPLSAPARQLLIDISEQQGHGVYVFPSATSRGGHVSDIQYVWETVCDAAGISNLRIHDLRHSYASYLASSGVGLPVIGALLGHTQASTTARYAHLFDDPLRAATEKVGAIISGQPVADVIPIKGAR